MKGEGAYLRLSLESYTRVRFGSFFFCGCVVFCVFVFMDRHVDLFTLKMKTV